MPDDRADSLTVALGDRSYPIHIGSNVLARAGSLLAGQGAQRAVVVTNPIVARHHLAPLRRALDAAAIASEVVVVPDGEAQKSWATLQDIVTRLIEIGAERSTLLIALGGGVVGDLTGFAAAIYRRGMPFVQIPTTLLAQVDSSVGGKTAINHPLGKNMIGAFYQPQAVLIDTDCLATLPDRELSAGIAEVVKYGAIRDRAFFDWLEANVDALLARDAIALAHAIRVSCTTKAAVVAGDERETSGERALLNFGHTFGHAIEAATGYGSWLHGEAVAAGMVLAAQLSVRIRGCPAVDATRLQSLLSRARLPVAPPAIGLSKWIELIRRDKKVAAGRMRFVLLNRIGDAMLAEDVREDDLTALLERLAN